MVLFWTVQVTTVNVTFYFYYVCTNCKVKTPIPQYCTITRVGIVQFVGKTPTLIKHQKHSPWWNHLTLQQHGYGELANIVAAAFLEWCGQGQGVVPIEITFMDN
jgi:hypothetical protein